MGWRRSLGFTKEIVGDLVSRVVVVIVVVAAKPDCHKWEAEWKVKCEAKSRQHLKEVQWKERQKWERMAVKEGHTTKTFIFSLWWERSKRKRDNWGLKGPKEVGGNGIQSPVGVITIRGRESETDSADVGKCGSEVAGSWSSSYWWLLFTL